MENIIPYIFRFIMYVLFGLSLEVLFSIKGIERVLGTKIDRRVPDKYAEGFVSAYMIPLHGLGILFGFEYLFSQISDWHIILRYLIWCVSITGMEIFWGFICHKILGFYSWDYYKLSRFKVFKEGYTLWTQVPLWGIAGLILEVYTQLMIHVSPSVVDYF